MSERQHYLLLGVMFIIMAAILFWIAYSYASASASVPTHMHATVLASDVTCYGIVCCASIVRELNGYDYTTPLRGWCRWFRSPVGETVMLMRVG